MTGQNFYIIAGEPSGDALGAELMAGMATETAGAAGFAGVGGALMAGQGLDSRLPIDRLAVMGLAEVLPRLPELMRHIRDTAEDVIARRPAALITIDSPDFCLRVAAKAKAALPDLKVIHYVAPSVWAWRPGRAAKMARHVDHVLALLPFEPPFMTAAGMTCDFVGHPVAHSLSPDPAAGAAFRAAHGIAPDARLITLLPGSRGGEVARHGPLFRSVWDRLSAENPDLCAVIPAVAARAATLRAQFTGSAVKILDAGTVTPAEAEARKRGAFAASDLALAASGTVSLELAAMGTPMVVAYRVNPLTAAIVKRMVRTDYASLVNILTDAAVIPEYLGPDATADALGAEMARFLGDRDLRRAQTARFADVMQMLGRGSDAPGLRAARSVLAAVSR